MLRRSDCWQCSNSEISPSVLPAFQGYESIRCSLVHEFRGRHRPRISALRSMLPAIKLSRQEMPGSESTWKSRRIRWICSSAPRIESSQELFRDLVVFFWHSLWAGRRPDSRPSASMDFLALIISSKSEAWSPIKNKTSIN